MAIVYIESNTTGFGHRLLEASCRYDAVYWLVRDPSRYGFAGRLPAGLATIACDTRSLDALAQAVSGIGAIRYVASTSDGFIEIAAHLSERLGLPCNPSAAIALCRDKLRLGEVLQARGVPYPATREVRRAADMDMGIGFPAIVKPRQGTGSIGVRLVTDARGMPDAQDGPWIAQRFVEGTEFSVETFSDGAGHHVLAVTRKYVTRPPYFLELAHVLPADIGPDANRRIVETVTRALDAVGYAFGPAHTEVKLQGDAATVIEINARLAGGMIPRLLEYAFGWSVADLYVRSHLAGRSQFAVPEPALHAAVAFIVPDVGRRYLGIDFPEGAADAGAFQDGGTNQGRFDFSDRAGYVIAGGRTALSALRAALMLRNRSQVLYAPPEVPPPDAATVRSIALGERSAFRPGSLAGSLFLIEKAHLLMLRSQGILSAGQFRQLRDAVLAAEAEPELLRAHASGRGDYFDYEHYVIDRCGEATGGMVQAARSRNDINATHLLLTLRRAIAGTLDRSLRLGKALLERAEATVETILPIHSQYQVAMPGTAGHYLSAQATAVLGTMETLSSLQDGLDTSPLGACAGAGTTFRTITHETARLLGCVRGPSNSLAAISDKTPALRCAYLFIELSGHLNRLAIDLQLWTMRETGFVRLPEAMYGGSSNMPQKRNPYLLEWLRLHHDRHAGQFAGMLSSLSHLPTGNSYQASRCAVESIADLAGSLGDMCTVATYAIAGMRFDEPAIRRALGAGDAHATLAAEALVQEGRASFREAHTAVGHLLAQAPAEDSGPLAARASGLLAQLRIELEHGQPFDRLGSGGGPAASSTREAIAGLHGRLRRCGLRQLAAAARFEASRRELDTRFRRIR
ncbi:lyase family protein [Paracidovorax cattleyae]|uniref:argininosuccinate lyase n=1 Tax=Paracidovorax cattleyae TaxID=80868 RepID=A0A1H0SPL4_9BURK|nr:lyase family protein [Paracidovorax cattleyae]AVS74527.1 ATP-grasp domain-containing protein [Paracidovorax cattleyae]SDP43660.1 argininosuccinate lyase [Paracidovorax cattleyae]